MPWQRRRFKGNKVFVRTDEAGNPAEIDGRVEVRYKLNDPRAYKVAVRSLEPLLEDGADRMWADEEAAPGEAPPARSSAGGQRGARAGGPGGSRAGGSGTNGARTRTDLPDASRAPAAQLVASEGAALTGPFLGDREPIIVYTDGACSGNPGPAGIGVVMICGGKRKEVSEFLGKGTSNIAELTAIKRALELIRDPQRTVILHVDSAYSIGVLGHWKAKANQKLIESIKEDMARFPDLRLIKVPGHAGVPENERCDELAREAVSRGR